MPTPEKEAAVKAIKEKLAGAKTAVFTEFRGLNVHDLAELRAKLRSEGVEYTIVKNTLTKRAARELEIEALDRYLEGPTAIAFGYDDEVAPARLLAEYGKEHEELKMKCGMLGTEVLDAERVKALATIPGKDVLIAKLLGSLQSPMAGLARVCSAPATALVNVLHRVADQKA